MTSRNNRILWLLIVGMMVFGVGSAWAALQPVRPVAVSPGDASKLELIEGRCPTFSWGALPGAESYEMVVYRGDKTRKEASTVLQQVIAGTALSWTPSLARCLERGGQYAWIVRAVGEKGASDWSAPSLFEVSAGSSDTEFEEAVNVVRKHLAERDRADLSILVRTESTAKVKASGSPPSATSPTSPAPTVFNADGNINAVSYTGDGSKLTNVARDAEDEICRLFGETAVTPLPDFCGLLVFITSATFGSGNLVAAAAPLGYTGADGLEAGDFICQSLAFTAGLNGTYKVYLSTDAPLVQAKDRLTTAHKYWDRVDGARVADNLADLLDCTEGTGNDCLENYINIDEGGNVVPDIDGVWSNTTEAGVENPASVDCLAFTGFDPGIHEFGFLRASDGRTRFWVTGQTSGCGGVNAHLYCFGQ